MKTSEILRAAKARLTPETWRRFHDPEQPCKVTSLCVHLAITHGFDLKRGMPVDVAAALNLFAWVAVGPARDGDLRLIWNWNDDPSRTLQDVHSAFDAAILIAEQREGVIVSELEFAEA